jgi:hypothetical protein
MGGGSVVPGQLALNLALAWSFHSRVLIRRIGYVILADSCTADTATTSATRNHTYAQDAETAIRGRPVPSTRIIQNMPNSQPRLWSTLTSYTILSNAGHAASYRGQLAELKAPSDPPISHSTSDWRPQWRHKQIPGFGSNVI